MIYRNQTCGKDFFMTKILKSLFSSIAKNQLRNQDFFFSFFFFSFLRKKALKNQEKNPQIIPVPGVMQILKQRFT